MNALDELLEYLSEGEEVEAIVFGEWWPDQFSAKSDIPSGPKGYLPVPKEMRGKAVSLEEATPYMDGWSFWDSLGACYAAYIWTNKRVIWVNDYDASISLQSAPRNPVDVMPEMS